MTGKTTPARPPLNLGGDQSLDGTYHLGTGPRIAPLTPCGSCVLCESVRQGPLCFVILAKKRAALSRAHRPALQSAESSTSDMD